MTLTEFLLARIAEDEQAASHEDGGLMTDAHFSKRRVLAECEAKRRIVNGWSVVPYIDSDLASRQVHETTGHVFRCLALPYADHSDYRDEWKP